MDKKGGIGLLILFGAAAYLYSTKSEAAFQPGGELISIDDPQQYWILPDGSITYSDPNTDYSIFDTQTMDEPWGANLQTNSTENSMPIGRDWKINEYSKYAEFLRITEDRNGIPRDLLARQLAKETGSFQADIISGARRSPVGAMGIGQFMPATGAEYGLLPGTGPGSRADPIASIAAAGKYMKALFRQFNSWRYALMAYNWGPGYVAHWLKGDLNPATGKPYEIPAETRDYVASISADVPVA